MEELEKKLQSFLEENNATIDYEITFPKYKTVPEEAVLALKVLTRHGMKFVVKISNISR